MAKTTQFKLDLKARPSRNVFDRSYRINATASLGLLRPFFCKEVIAGTKMQLGFENVTRMSNLQSPAFARLHEHMDYFFVPYSQLWRPFEQFRTQQSHYMSSALSEKMENRIPLKVPTIPYHDLIFNLQAGPNYGGSLIGTSELGHYSNIDSCGYSSMVQRYMLLHYLGYGNYMYNEVNKLNTPYDLKETANKDINLFRLAAFQKCYYDYYRNEKYEKNSLLAYNLDDVAFVNGETGDGVDIIERLGLLTDVHYRWRKKDYFMSVTPELIPVENFIGFEGFAYMQINLYSAGGAATPSTYRNTYAYPSATNYEPNGTTPMPANLGSTVMPTNTGVPEDTPDARRLDVNSLKLMFAREKLLKRMYMAKNNYSSQMMALFGFAPSTLRTDQVYHIGGCSNRIIVDDTPIYGSVNDTTESDPYIGRYAGKVAQYSNNKKCAEFTASEDGVVLGIYSTSIENDYAANGIERDNMRIVPEDYPYQEYQDLGRQALYRSEFGNFQRPATAQDSVKDGCIGFVERYLEYKTSYDKVFYPFIKTRGIEIENYDYMRFATPLNTWIRSGSASQLPRITNPQNLYIQTMLVAPWQLDNIAGTKYDGTPTTDAFLINGYNHFKAITPLKEKEF